MKSPRDLEIQSQDERAEFVHKISKILEKNRIKKTEERMIDFRLTMNEIVAAQKDQLM